MQAVTGRTRVAAVIGDPVTHSRSPAIHNAAFAAVGIDWVFVALTTPGGRVDVALDAMATFGLGGLSVTMPHKQPVAAAVGRLSPLAAQLGAVNCVAWDGDELVGHNTDATGFVAMMNHSGFDLAGRTVAVVGAGGAGRAVVAGAVSAGAGRVVVVNRSDGAAHVAAALDPGRCLVGTAGDIGACDVVVNATPVGMAGTPGLAVASGLLHGDQVVVDLVYDPLDTELLREARQVGAATIDGLGLLVFQAAEAFTLWTGLPAPVEIMLAAAAT